MNLIAKKTIALAALALLLAPSIADAGGGRSRGGMLRGRFGGGCSSGSCGSQQDYGQAGWSCQPMTCQPDAKPVETAPKPPETKPDGDKPKAKADDGVSVILVEVNNERARRGLRPFRECRLLTQAAETAARIRAERCCHGHLTGGMGDFACLPPGARADAAGCAAWQPGTGWGACCTYDNYQYAGAAAVVGRDGMRYMHLFVRN